LEIQVNVACNKIKLVRVLLKKGAYVM